MSEHDRLIGRTITDITLLPSEFSNPSDMDGIVLVLDNGDRVHIRGESHDDSCVTLIPRTEAEWNELVETTAKNRRDHEERRERAAAKRESDGKKWEAAREHMRSLYGPRIADMWERRYPDPRRSGSALFPEVTAIYEEFVSSVNRQTFGP